MKPRRWWSRSLVWLVVVAVMAAAILGLAGNYPGAAIVVLAMIAIFGIRLLLHVMVMPSKNKKQTVGAVSPNNLAIR